MPMQFNRKALSALLNMSDEQLESVIRNLASEHGIDQSFIKIDSESIGKLRSALANTSDAELREIISKVDPDSLGRGKNRGGGNRNGN